MVEPLSLAGILIAIPPVAAALITIASDIKEARKDIQNLVGDLFTLKGVLEYVQSVRIISFDKEKHNFDSAQFDGLLHDAGSILAALKLSLKVGDSVVAQKWKSIKWHFKKTEVLEHRQRLEEELQPSNLGRSGSTTDRGFERQEGCCVVAARKVARSAEQLSSEINRQDSTVCTRFYCSFGTLASQQLVNILASILVQACEAIPSMYDKISTKYAEAANAQQPRSVEASELLQILVEHVTKVSRFYICIDAVNESTEAEIIQKTMGGLAGKCKNIRLFITSTHEPHESAFREARFITSTMKANLVDHDIATYLDEEITTSDELRKCDPLVREEIRRTILGRSSGVFRFAESQLQLTRIAAQHTGREVRRQLSRMPSSLNETYVRSLGGHINNPIHRRYLRTMLLWLSFATRPLTLRELSEAIVVEDEDTDLDEQCRLHDPNVLLQLGQGLVELDKFTGFVSLGHSSVKTCLTSTYIQNTEAADFALNETNSHDLIMRTCVTYLRFRPFRIDSRNTFDTLSARYPLLSYAALNWPLHITGTGTATLEGVRHLISTQHMPRGGAYAFWILYVSRNVPLGVILQTSPLYYASSFGFTKLVAVLLADSHGLDLERPEGRVGSTALQVACFRRQKGVVKLLVEAGANSFSPDGSGVEGGFSSLFWAKNNGWDDIVELMIEHGVANKHNYRDRSHGVYAVDLAKKVQAVSLQDTHACSTVESLICTKEE
ncbi:hypothetical protein SNOG_10827 [Parastagonospora nodorum SN15]|uniref:Uncharacterized protein n=1 Tax=Phaeosphaeria nodorum (strain SN15 / ATCC MYA-4574 / FGSC 10173) TaxID=321614 RepID=Q0UBN7_PHANO|nr:hypothetical protein SNOG_10827 [Parastagonospora nodorum SN15]EAT82221.1 hypothetical protein SNOG_10827 [Parastagonospora nodorum SN15]